MARTAKCRKVCAEPASRTFRPEPPNEEREILCVEELEALRLCDLEELGQDEAAKRMEISRGTLQRLLYAARKKTAGALVGGKCICIQGGNYEISPRCGSCEHACRFCKKRGDVKNE